MSVSMVKRHTGKEVQIKRFAMDNRELTILGQERRPRLHKTKTAITDIKAVHLCRKHNLKDLLSE